MAQLVAFTGPGTPRPEGGAVHLEEHHEATRQVLLTSTRRGADGWRTSLLVGRVTPGSTGMTTEERELKPGILKGNQARLKCCVQSGKDTPELFHPELLHTCISNLLKPCSDQQTVPHHSLSSLGCGFISYTHTT
ncbi:unnamed protein product [Arctogadus glacialis]